jgi:hypothetical protein
MKNWLVRIKCFILGHKVIVGNKCPVTGIVRLDCESCGISNMPKHTDKEGMFR